MTNNPNPAEHRDAARGFLSSVHATHHLLTQLYGKPNKTTDDWTKISELKCLIHAGYDAAQVHATLALTDAVSELIAKMPEPPAAPGWPETMV